MVWILCVCMYGKGRVAILGVLMSTNDYAFRVCNIKCLMFEIYFSPDFHLITFISINRVHSLG